MQALIDVHARSRMADYLLAKEHASFGIGLSRYSRKGVV